MHELSTYAVIGQRYDCCSDAVCCRRGTGHHVSEGATTAVGAVFQGLLEAALRDAAAGAFEDEAEDEGTGVICFSHTEYSRLHCASLVAVKIFLLADCF